MGKVNLFSQKWCDLVFSGRNKDYGAYRIRSETGRRYFVALIVLFLLLLVFLGIPIFFGLWVNYRTVSTLNEVKVEVRQLKPLQATQGYEVKFVASELKRPNLQQKKSAVQTKPEIVEETDKEFELGVDTLVTENLSEASGSEVPPPDSAVGSGEEPMAAETLPIIPIEQVDELPQFPGGNAELMKWLDQHIPYPKVCQNAGISGELHLSFMIDSDGTVINPQITKTLHPVLERIVLNAMRSMPKWSPGKVNGIPVLVCVTVPVYFHSD